MASNVPELAPIETDQSADQTFAKRNQSSERQRGPLTSKELKVQRRFWERRAQQEGMKSEKFEEDRRQLNLLECRGRIQGVYPVYLPEIAVYTKFIQEAHESTLHGGAGMTMAKVREQHWVPQLRGLVKRVIKKCSGCKRFQATALDRSTSWVTAKGPNRGNHTLSSHGS